MYTICTTSFVENQMIEFIPTRKLLLKNLTVYEIRKITKPC